jgi:hypothetical protein
MIRLEILNSIYTKSTPTPSLMHHGIKSISTPMPSPQTPSPPKATPGYPPLIEKSSHKYNTHKTISAFTTLLAQAPFPLQKTIAQVVKRASSKGAEK